MPRVTEENIVKTYGIFRFLVFRFIKLLVRIFFPKEENEEFMEMLYEDIRVRRLYVNPDDFEPYDEYHALYKGKYYVWIKNGAFSIDVKLREPGKSAIFCQKIFDRDNTPEDFRKAMYNAYEYKRKQLAKKKFKDLATDFSFLVDVEAPSLQEVVEEPGFGNRLESD